MFHTPFFPAFRPRLAPQGRRSAQALAGLRQATLSQIEVRLSPALPADLLQKPSSGDHSREQVFTLLRTFWCWIWQVLQQNTSCRQVVRQVQALLALTGVAQIDEDNSAYCQARTKVPQGLLERVFAATAQSAERRVGPSPLLQGRSLRVVDGSGTNLPDTPPNRNAFPPTSSQRKGCGFPYLRLVVLFSLASGALLARATGSLASGELPLFVGSLLASLKQGDILIGDRAYSLYVIAALLQGQGVDLIARLSTRKRRKIDFRKATKRFGQNDALFTWEKQQSQVSKMISLEEWGQLPELLTVRFLRVRTAARGFRTQQLTLITTLLDPKLYPAEEIIQAYARRWRMELCLDDLKTTLGMQSLSCLSPEMVRKELLIFLSTYNLLRWIMAEAAQNHRVDLERISFKGSLDAFRQWTQALAQLGRAKNKMRRRAELWEQLLRIIARDLIPERPGRKEPRAVKKRSKYPRLNRPRHQYRERFSRTKRRRIFRAKRRTLSLI